ncbi:ABC transporter substrate-binding protein [Vallitalea okinawensis]|uniref:ABC transporter substrate-binding protein n=1 Tax=Vallitalea okinawensis TaxID=2078660 RepID=UPI00130029DC|nr:ABC transporter substrate-binding protein [Vallitalea okinawensis]
MKKVISIVLVLSLIITLFVGCSKDETPAEQNNAESKSEATKPEDKQEEITLRYMWWGSDSRHEATLAAIEKYEELNPHIKIEPEFSGWDGYYQKLVTQLAGGTAADIMQVDQPWLGDLLKNESTFADLSSVDTTNFDSNFLNQYCIFNDQLVGVPMGINGLTMIINTTFFNEVGIDYNALTDWESIVEAGKEINSQYADKYILYDTGMLFDTYLNQVTGNQLVKDDLSLGFTEEEVLKAFQFVDTIYENKVVQPKEESALFKTTENPSWIDNNMGMTMQWPSMINSLDSDNKELEVISIPQLEAAKASGVVVRPSMLISVNGKGSYIEESAKFIDWLVNSDEGILTLKAVRGVPASAYAQDLLVENDLLNPLQQKGVSMALENPRDKVNFYSSNAEVSAVKKEIIDKVALDISSPEEAAAEMITRIQQVVDEIKN